MGLREGGGVTGFATLPPPLDLKRERDRERERERDTEREREREYIPVGGQYKLPNNQGVGRCLGQGYTIRVQMS